MSGSELGPLTFTPVLKDYLWGGRRLQTVLGRPLPPGPVAESWEVSGHRSGLTKVSAGPLAGEDLASLTEQLGVALVGARGRWAAERHKFPLLVKLLDAHAALSVQVHPDDDFAERWEHGELGKAEMYYVLHADEGAQMVYGLKPGVDPVTLRSALRGGSAEGVLNYTAVRTGDVVAVQPGTVHALLGGVLVTEIQRSSDATYRLYDWGRVGLDGKARELHIEKALEVIDFGRSGDGVVTPETLSMAPGLLWQRLVVDSRFVVEKVALQDGAQFEGACDGSTMEIWGCLAGCATFQSGRAEMALPAVGYVLLPATLGGYTLCGSPSATCLRVYLPPS